MDKEFELGTLMNKSFARKTGLPYVLFHGFYELPGGITICNISCYHKVYLSGFHFQL